MAKSAANDNAGDRVRALRARMARVRDRTDALCAPLEIEDYGLQAMPEVSPVKWHIAHTAWYFETFVLSAASRNYVSRFPAFRHLFNSYYNGVGEQYPRPQRGLLSRPTVAEVQDYRSQVYAALEDLLDGASCDPEWLDRIELGTHHEQQHQELILTDLKYCLSCNPLAPVYRAVGPASQTAAEPAGGWVAFPETLARIGHTGEGFCFDNETPVHRVLLAPYRLARLPVSNAEYLAFMADGGYERPELWLSDGWTERTAQGWRAPLYWTQADGAWRQFTLHGHVEVDPAAPVAHVSYYEADAYARWAGARLPREAEWEHAAGDLPASGQFAGDGWLHPMAAGTGEGLQQMFGGVWEWTASAYEPYPGFRPLHGELGEYNGKFMCNQMVLRGGSCATPEGHARATYRNFFYPRDRWQFSGIRLAQDGSP